MSAHDVFFVQSRSIVISYLFVCYTPQACVLDESDVFSQSSPCGLVGWHVRGFAANRLLSFRSSACSMSSSESYTLAGPDNRNPSFPVIFATEPSGARFPFNT